MVFRRKVYDKLCKWKELSAGSSAVMLEGARRICKSTIVEEFAKNEYDDYMILDFAREKDENKNNFKENIGNMDSFFRNLFLLKGRSLSGNRCVIIFDEVQLFPLARQAIKYLVADGRYDYIETGSLISIRKNVKDILIPSEEYRLKMFPMDFEEFLWACGDDVTIPVVKEAFQKRKALGDNIHRKVMKDFRTYMVVGGMPQAVHSFVLGKTFEQIDFMNRNILDLYEEDLEKYDDENHEKASIIYQTIPEQLESRNSHFKFSKIDKNARYKNYVDAVNFIAQSMIGNECINVTKPEISLKLYADASNFKLYFGDTGLLVTQIMRNSQDTGNDLYKALSGYKSTTTSRNTSNTTAGTLQIRQWGPFVNICGRITLKYTNTNTAYVAFTVPSTIGAPVADVGFHITYYGTGSNDDRGCLLYASARSRTFYFTYNELNNTPSVYINICYFTETSTFTLTKI